MEGIVSAWGRILAGYRPSLSIEITRECPLRCPGCYAYLDEHLGGEVTLRQVSDFKGDELVTRFFELIDAHRPLHVSIVGGEPLVRFRELNTILPRLADQGVYTQLVTSAVRQIPPEWAKLRRLQLVVSIDGLQPEHDERRKPATYDRILKHIVGHDITVHCTVTRQQVRREGYLEEFIDYWSDNPTRVAALGQPLHAPGGRSVRRATHTRGSHAGRRRPDAPPAQYPKLRMPEGLVRVYQEPPKSPDECVFALTTTCVSADFKRPISPCQFGGNPDCANCGCIASAGLKAIARHRLPGGIRVGAIFEHSLRIGRKVRRMRTGAAS